MQIETKFHGSVSLEGALIYEFPQGLPGFEDNHSFTILPIDGNDMFQVLQSTDTPGVAFVVANPYTLIEQYDIRIDEPTIDLLGIESEEEVFVLTVVTVKEPFNQSTLNLQAPLVFNVKTKKGKQMILNDASYDMRHPIDKGAK